MAAERAQNYLDVHKIGSLFENLMASLIKDMPNEPIPYLIRMLQKADQRLRSPRGVPDRVKSASSSTLHSKYGIGVAGHAAPKRSIEEPHMALPGGGKAGALWSSTNLSSSQGRLASKGRPKTAEQKKRGYEKPWLSGSKPGSTKAMEAGHKTEKHVPHHRELGGETTKKTTLWNSDTKVTAKDFDEICQSQQSSQLKTATNAEQKDIIYEGVQSWAAGDENLHTGKRIALDHGNRKALHDLTNDEMDGKESNSRRSMEVNVDSEMEISRGRKLTASNKADQKRIKLKAILDDKDRVSGLCNGHDDNEESSDDETVEVFEYSDDLEDEGVQRISNLGAKVKGTRQRDDAANFQIKICARCAKVMASFQSASGFSDCDSQFTATQKPPLSDITGSVDDFESVSQIADPNSQQWPVISPDDEELPTQMNSGSNISMGKTEFFKTNAPSRSSQVKHEIEGSEIGSQMEQPQIGGAQAWAIKTAESSTDFSP